MWLYSTRVTCDLYGTNICLSSLCEHAELDNSGWRWCHYSGCDVTTLKLSIVWSLIRASGTLFECLLQIHSMSTDSSSEHWHHSSCYSPLVCYELVTCICCYWISCESTSINRMLKEYSINQAEDVEFSILGLWHITTLSS